MKTFPSTLKDEGKGRKKGKGKKKVERVQKKHVQVREENIFKGAGEGFQQCYVLKTFPSTLKDEVKGRKKGRGEEKRGRGEEKRCAGKGRKYFQRCWGRFSTMLCLETFPSTLKKWREGKKKEEEGKKKDAQGRE